MSRSTQNKTSGTSEREFWWRQRNGELIKVDDMNEQHMRNVIKYMISRNPNCGEIRMIPVKEEPKEITDYELF